MKGSMTIEASYIFPFCFLIIAIVCYLGIFKYNQAVLKTTGYECILQSMNEKDLSEEALQQTIVKKAEQLAKARVLGVEKLNVAVKMTVSKISVTFQGRQRVFDLNLNVTTVYERTYPELTLRLLSGRTGGIDEGTVEKGIE